ncbi:MAG: putative bifunctional diguanylate cyclase/phosphodiesterase [Halorhodospira sp.]
MERAHIPDDEDRRQAALERYRILDTDNEPVFDRIAQLACRIFGTSIATITFVDRHRQWFKAAPGLQARETPRDLSFCGHVVAGADPLIVPDAYADRRFHDNPLVTEAPGIRAYLGVPLTTEAGLRVGVLCVQDVQARAFSEADAETLRELADVTVYALEARLAQFDAERLMHLDPLTGLPNRLLFSDRLQQAMASRQYDGKDLAVLALDLRDFRTVNDSLGREQGDRLLAKVGERLQASLRRDDTVARLSGDEFGILLARLGDTEDSASLAWRIIEAVEAPYELDGVRVQVTARVGISVRSGGNTAELLMERADAAMYEAKSEEAPCRYFDQDLTERARERLELSGELRRALAEGQLSVHYQPQVDLATGSWVGMEALARWHHPEQGWISPGRFIPVAERAGLITALGRQVLEQACAAGARLRREGVGIERVAVNIASPQLEDPAFVDEVCAILQEAGLPPACLELEVTERLMVSSNSAALGRLAALRRHGVRVAVDDFGTGYSSLSYLRDLPIGRLKIDRSFIRGIPEDQRTTAITRVILSLGDHLDLEVIAEGIETEAERAALVAEGCRQGQGFYFAHPAPAHELAAWTRPGA